MANPKHAAAEAFHPALAQRAGGGAGTGGAGMQDLESLNAAFVIDIFLLLLIGVGPKLALVPFLDVTAGMSEATKRRVQRKMLTTAATVAVILLVLGGLLAALAVQLALNGLSDLGVIHLTTGH